MSNIYKDIIIPRSASGVRKLEWTETRITTKVMQVTDGLTFLIKSLQLQCTRYLTPLLHTRISKCKSSGASLQVSEWSQLDHKCRHCSLCTHIPSKKQVCGSQTWASLRPQIADSPGLLKVKKFGGRYSIARPPIANTTHRLPVGEIKLLGSST